MVICAAEALMRPWRGWQVIAWPLVLLLAVIVGAVPQTAKACEYATAQGTNGPADWDTYCWLNFASYDNATATSTSGQNFTMPLKDGSTLTFNLKVTTATANPLRAIASPSWSGASFGNNAFLGVGGTPILYQSSVNGGTSTVTFSNIAISPPPGGIAGAYMFVAADGESTANGESLRFVASGGTNPGPWELLRTVANGGNLPTLSGISSSTVNITGATTDPVGSYVIGARSPSTVVATMVGGGLQGVMFAVRFASIRLTASIPDGRVTATDQFTYAILNNSGSTLVTRTSSGTGTGPFPAANLSAGAGYGVRLFETPAGTTVASNYTTFLTCTNGNTGSATALPIDVVTTDFNFGMLNFGDGIVCNFANRRKPLLRLSKAIPTTTSTVNQTGPNRVRDTDQFTLSIASPTATLSSFTTTGTAASVTNNPTAYTTVQPGVTYVFDEKAAGTTDLAAYRRTMGCTQSGGTAITLPTAPGGSITPQFGTIVSCTITNARRTIAVLSIDKTSGLVSDPVNNATNPFHIPGAIVRYTLRVSNAGSGPVDSNTVFVLDTLPANLLVGTAAAPSFTQGTPTSALTFTAGTDVRYSNAASPPASFAACTYTPTLAYDPNVRYVCFNPKGVMPAATTTGNPTFSVSFNAQIR